MRIKDQDRFGSGALFIVVGVGASVLSLGYQIGTPARMGSGFFPLCLGIALCILGLILVAQSCSAESGGSRLERWDIRNLLIILASVIAFALVLPSFGLALAIIGLVVVSSFADKGLRRLSVLWTASALAVLCYFIFIVGLELQLPFLPDFG